MSTGSHDWVLFFGRFHPVLVHLPIGGLVVVAALELLDRVARFKGAAQRARLILGLTTISAAVVALLGWLLSHAGGYEPQLLLWHEWSGFTLAAMCAVTWLLSRLGNARAYALSLVGTLAALTVASHFGGSLTHGRDYLTAFAPAPLRDLLAGRSGPAVAPGPAADLSQRRVFQDLIHPILQQRCSVCHGPEKRKGGLSFEDYENLRKGGKDGAVIIPGKAIESPLIQRLLLPPEDEDHMPPHEKPQPTQAQIVALQWWIEQGAPEDKTISELKPSPELQRLLEAAQKPGK